jgi:putative endonuclease
VSRPRPSGSPPRSDSLSKITSTAIGRAAEQRVAALLESRGYTIVGVNVRVGRDELDVVAFEGETLVVVEVRARGSLSHGHAFETVKRGKQARLRRAVERYVTEHEIDEVRVDVAAVDGESIEIIENAIDFTST